MLRATAIEIISVGLPKIAGGVVTLGLNLALMRFLLPDEYGVYGICVAGIILTDAIIGSSVDMGVLRFASHREPGEERLSASFERTALQAKAIFALAALAPVLMMSPAIAAVLLQESARWPAVVLSFGAAMGLLLFRSALVHAQIQGKFRLYGALELLHNTVKFGGAALLMLTGRASAATILALFVTSPLSAFGVAMWNFRRQDLWALSIDRDRLRQLYSLAKWYALTGGLGNIVTRLDIIALTLFSTLQNAGLFSAAQALASVPPLLGSYLSIVFAPKIMPLYQTGRFQAFYRRLQWLLAGLAFPAMVITLVGLHTSLASLLPQKFVPSAVLTMILAPGSFIAFTTVPLALSTVMFLRPRFLFQLDSMALPVLALAYYAAVREHGAVGAAAVSCISQTVRSAVVQACAWRLSRAAPDHQRHLPAGDASTRAGWRI
ncbi:MAG: oligosaccharide flippase family protein [Bryobacterales bacterium]|nr:oligosaccharide flippase family protein [Bryobacterales bacterium]